MAVGLDLVDGWTRLFDNGFVLNLELKVKL